MINGAQNRVQTCCRKLAIIKHPLTFIALFALAALAHASEIGCVFPAGGAPGTTLEVSVRGQGLKNASGAHFSGTGVDAALVQVIPFDPVKPGKLQKARQLQDEVILRVTLSKEALPGARDLRLICGNDFTVPVAFHVGRYPETLESEPNNTPGNCMALENLPVCVNGRINELDTDTFCFKAVKGQTLVAQVHGRALLPYLADTAPGWFQPLLTLFDAQGHELLCAAAYRFDPDPILVFTAPATGDYVLQLCDASHRGREDFVYRLTLGEMPLVTGFSPMGGRKGDNLNITLEGVNLPPQRVRIFSGNKTSETCLQTLLDGKLSFPALRFDLDALPEWPESEPVAGGVQAQTVPVPVIVNGTINQPSDVDRYRFEGKAGQSIAIETRAQQLGSPLDTVVTLADSRGTVLATQDNPANVFTGLLTDPCDSAITLRLASDDTYEICVRDARGKGGPDYHYRLRISEPRPDFELWVTPSTLSIPLGGSVRANVHVRRIDGFSGPIALQLDNPPLGISCEGGNIPILAAENVITLSATASTKRLPQAPFELNLSGLATNGAVILRQTAVPAHRIFQAPSYNPLVPDQTWMAVVNTQSYGYALQIVLPPQAPCIKASATKPFEVTISGGKAKAYAEYVTVRVTEPERGFIVSNVRDGTNPGELLVTLACEKGERAPPKMGNLILGVSRKSPKYKTPKRPQSGTLTTAAPYVIE